MAIPSKFIGAIGDEREDVVQLVRHASDGLRDVTDTARAVELGDVVRLMWLLGSSSLAWA